MFFLRRRLWVLGWVLTLNASPALQAGVASADCNQNEVADVEDIANETSPDCNQNSVPDECEFCVDPSLCGVQFLAVSALGEAQIDFEGPLEDRRLHVTGIGSSGEDGVAFGLRTARADVGLEESHLEEPEASLTLRVLGQVDEQSASVMGELRLTHVAGSLQVAGDLSPLGVETYRLLIFQGDLLVSDQGGLPSAEFQASLMDFSELAFDLGASCVGGGADGSPCGVDSGCFGGTCVPGPTFSGRLRTSGLFMIPNFGGTLGDRFVVVGETTTIPPEKVEEISLLAAGSGPLVLLAPQPPGIEPAEDCNDNGVPDECDLASQLEADCDDNGVPDSCDLALGGGSDCDQNGVLDRCDLEAGTAQDCDDNGILDSCDVLTGALDCNENGVPDACEVVAGTVLDCNVNGIPDACDLEAGGAKDCNQNGVPDTCELAGGTVSDCNQNAVPDVCDLVQEVDKDCNQNGIPDACELAGGGASDCDQSGVPDACEIASGTLLDCNANGVPDGCDLAAGLADCDQTGVPDVCEIATGSSGDCNADGVPDVCQLTETEARDCDQNGVPDFCDLLGGASDCNLNGVPDSCDIAAGLSDCNEDGVLDVCDVAAGGIDCNTNGVPDDCELAGRDCNETGILDACEVADGGSADCNANQIPDECELADVVALDCDENGIPDTCDVIGGMRRDCNQNGVPDRCEIAAKVLTDCDRNGIADECEVVSGAAVDCNGNGIPDVCDLSALTSPDCNGNGVPDSCDLAAGTSRDEDGDRRPDECDDKPPVTPRDAYDQVVASATLLRGGGLIPQETLDFLVGAEADLAVEAAELLDAVRVVSFQETGVAIGEMGGGAVGGVSSGATWLAISAGGLVVGRLRLDMSWNNNQDDCFSAVGGHTFSGGVINGACNSAQVGAFFADGCVPTQSCSSLDVECGTLQIQCQQQIGSVTVTFNTPLESLCAGCVEVPLQRPGDCNQDGDVDIGDATCLFGFLFLGRPRLLPCGSGVAAEAGNLALLDWNGDSVLDLSDGIGELAWLFNQTSESGLGAPHVQGNDCQAIPFCSAGCAR